MIIISTLIFLTAIGYWFLQSRSNKRPQAARTKIRQENNRSTRYHAVTVLPGGCSCSAVAALDGQRFLTRENVPNLPLLECSSANCTCRYVHHEDRRGDNDNRRAAYSMQTEFYGLDAKNRDRRAKQGRRATDVTNRGTEAIDYREVQWSS